ncbi:hemerythrin domain-containing protein [Actinomadura bangladeshensis]|uniref:Hemerythrin domain-containing protein n=1 Tax=Actinomadura bangladeshensis TaxID=453573 RepID=A0A4R4P6I5_9ACTN|nr:hemerythrin domain-containing protein [Actinomadura bangladeshensis]TDC15742.1 hemerythrin domain-containing protein [Actinomadura bangladeshensis]
MAKYDWTAMYVMHDALRRELEHLSKLAAREDAEARRILAGAPGWDLFTTALHIHHAAEDEALWPPMRAALADRPDGLALMDAMEAEHASIDPALEAIDAGAEPLAPLIDRLATSLAAHLKHEEEAALPLMDETLPLEHFANFGQVHAAKLGPNAPRVIPWLLDGAGETHAATMLSLLPEPVQAAYKTQWRPTYESLDRWPTL